MLSGLPLPCPQLGFRGLSIRIFKNSPGDFTTEKCWPILFLFSYPVTSDSLDSTDCSTPGLLVPHHLHLGSLPKFMSTASVMPSSPLILWLPLLLLPSIFPSIRDFSNESSVPIRWPKYWNLASASVLPVNIQGWSPLRLTGLISLLFKGLSGVFSNTTVWRHQFFGILPFLRFSTHNCMWPLGRP